MEVLGASFHPRAAQLQSISPLARRVIETGGARMNIQSLLIDFVSTFLIVLVVTSIVTYLWSLIFHAAGAVDWETSFRMAIIFGILFPWINARVRKEQEKGG